MHDVSAIGLKLPGLVGSSAAELLGVSLITADFHSLGLTDWVQQMLKRWSKTGIRAGYFLKMTYPTLSYGDGVDADFNILMTRTTSLAEKGLQSISTSGCEGDGIHSGWTKFRGPEWYTSMKI